MYLNDFQKRLWLSSVQLVRLDEQMLPCSIASGCLIDYLGKRLLLTVYHATGDQGNWAIQKEYVQEKGTCIHQLGSMNFLAKATPSEPKLEAVDFSYVEVPTDFIAYRQEINVTTYSVETKTAITVHTPSLLDEPEKDQEFGFCGMVIPTLEKHSGQAYLGGDIRMYDQISFLRTKDNYHFFRLPFSHPGHEYFKGCSGAPVIDKSGRLVALVCGGCEKSNEIWGISLKAYKTPIDIFVNNFS